MKQALVFLMFISIAYSASAQFILDNQSASNSTHTNISNSINSSATTQATDSYIAQMQAEYHQAEVLRTTGELFCLCGLTGVITGVAVASAGSGEAWTYVAICSGLVCAAGIPMWIVGRVKLNNRYQYVSCISKEIDCGDITLEPSLGFTHDLQTHNDAPSVCLALKF